MDPEGLPQVSDGFQLVASPTGGSQPKAQRASPSIPKSAVGP